MQGKSSGRIRVRNGRLKTEDDAEVSEVLFALVTRDERDTIRTFMTGTQNT